MKKLKIAIVAGEESGDQLGSDLIQALQKKVDISIELVGVGGIHLEDLGLNSIIPSHSIALMGLGAVLKNFFSLLRAIKKVTHAIAAAKPDCLLLIDNQEFSYQIAKRVRFLDPKIPIIQYVAPSVWAWRPKRAEKIRPYIDHLLTILPFEAQVLKKLNGPQATYVGHKLISSPDIIRVKKERDARIFKEVVSPHILFLPGSRRFEIDHLMPIFQKVSEKLCVWYPEAKITLPTLEKHYSYISNLVKGWKFPPHLVYNSSNKWSVFTEAHVALAASGTVSLELALCNIPMVLSYKMDWFSKVFLLPKIKIWSAALPNIIAGSPIVPEYFNDFVHAEMLARHLNYLLKNQTYRQAQLNGFDEVREAMETDKSAGEIGAQTVIDILQEKGHSLHQK